MRKGSILLWDSRLPHGNWPNDSKEFRIVQYTGMYPVPVWENEKTFSFRKEQINYLLEDDETIELTNLGKKISGLVPFTKEEISEKTMIEINSIYNSNQCGYFTQSNSF